MSSRIFMAGALAVVAAAAGMKLNGLEAFNLETKKVLWIDRQRAPQTTGALATAGGAAESGQAWTKDTL